MKRSALILGAALASACAAASGDDGSDPYLDDDQGDDGNGGNTSSGGGSDSGGTGNGQAGDDGTGGEPDVGTQSQPYVSGSRLKAKFLETDGGARNFVGWYDSERDEDCAFGIAADGQQRCLPDALWLSARSYFSDANCSQQLANGLRMQRCDDDVPQYVWTYPAGSLCRSALFHVAGEYSGSVWSGSPGNCDEDSSARDLYLLYPLGAEANPSEFAQASVVIDD